MHANYINFQNSRFAFHACVNTMVSAPHAGVDCGEFAPHPLLGCGEFAGLEYFGCGNREGCSHLNAQQPANFFGSEHARKSE
jgi:hypothetical protein